MRTHTAELSFVSFCTGGHERNFLIPPHPSLHEHNVDVKICAVEQSRGSMLQEEEELKRVALYIFVQSISVR